MDTQHLYSIVTRTQVQERLNGEFLSGLPHPRWMFLGRSNVGKSTLLNALLGKTLAKVSKEPGKTRAIEVYFAKEYASFFLDLPGYGFAKRSQKEQKQWAEVIETYVRNDLNLKGIFMLMDGRHPVTAADQEAFDYFSKFEIPLIPVFTKIDAIKNQKDRAKAQKLQKEWLRETFDHEEAFWVSSKSEKGLDQLKHFLLQSEP